MYYNVHMFKVSCNFNGDEKQFLVCAINYDEAEKQIYDYWCGLTEYEAGQPKSKSYITLSVSRLEGVIDVSGIHIARLY